MVRRLVSFLVLLILASSCGPWFDGLRSPNTVRKRFARRAAQGPGTLIRLSEVAPFGFKAVFLFGPYTQVSEIQASLGGDADMASRLARGIERRDDIHLLVFTFQHSPFDSMELPRSQVDFAPELANCGLLSWDPAFVVQKDGRLGLAPGVSCDQP